MENDFAILLAWPETKCKQAGAWYDSLMALLGINKNGYYKVGHAAYVLIKKETGECLYFDFGRYHAPKGYGRVRSASTDHDLRIYTRIHFDENGSPINLLELYDELQNKKACHGEGELIAGCIQINFENSLEKILEMQRVEFLKYGPFVRGGTNCSRFVRDAALSGLNFGVKHILLRFPATISPTPKWNTLIGKNKWLKLVSKNSYEKTVFTPRFTGTLKG